MAIWSVLIPMLLGYPLDSPPELSVYAYYPMYPSSDAVEFDTVAAIAVTPDGNLVLFGTILFEFDDPGRLPERGPAWVRVTPSGDILQMFHSNDLQGLLYALYDGCITVNGDLVATGVHHTNNGLNLLVYALTSTGGFLFERTYDFGYGVASYGRSIIPLPNGGTVVAGDFDGISSGVFLAKLTATGDTAWIHLIPDSSLNLYVKDVDRFSNGGYLLTGLAIDPTTSESLAFLLKTDSLGNPLWKRTYPGGWVENGLLMPDGGGIFAGTWNGDGNYAFLLFRTDSMGDTLWWRTTQYYGHPTHGVGVQRLWNGLLIAGGYTRLYHGEIYGWNEDPLIALLDDGGTFQWMFVDTQASMFDYNYYDDVVSDLVVLPNGDIAFSSTLNGQFFSLVVFKFPLDSFDLVVPPDSSWYQFEEGQTIPIQWHRSEALWGPLFYQVFFDSTLLATISDTFYTLQLSWLPPEGSHTLTIRAMDTLGHSRLVSHMLGVDFSPPEWVSGAVWGEYSLWQQPCIPGSSNITIDVTLQDPFSGVADSGWFFFKMTGDTAWDSIPLIAWGIAQRSPIPPSGDEQPSQYEYRLLQGLIPEIPLRYDTVWYYITYQDRSHPPNWGRFPAEGESFFVGNAVLNGFDLLSPVDSVALGTSVPTFTWHVPETPHFNGIISYRLILDGDLISVSQETTYTYALGDSLSEGFHWWYVRAWDGCTVTPGGWPFFTPSNTWGYFFVDLSPPVVETVSILPDTSFTGPFVIQTKIWDQYTPVDSVLLYYWLESQGNWNAVPMSQVSVLADTAWYAGTIPAVQEPWEEVRYYLWISDGAIPSNESVDPLNAPDSFYHFYGFAVDTTMDAFSLLAPTDSVILSASQIQLIWEASGGYFGVSQYEVYLDSIMVGQTTDTVWTLTDLSDGWHTWYVLAQDTMGYWRLSEQSGIFGVDTTAPQILWTQTWNSTTEQGPFQVLSFATDAFSGMGQMTLFYRRLEDSTWNSVPMMPLGTRAGVRKETLAKETVYRSLPSPWNSEESVKMLEPSSIRIGGFVGEIPEVSLNYDSVRYYVQASDQSWPPNSSVDPQGAPSESYLFLALVGLDSFSLLSPLDSTFLGPPTLSLLWEYPHTPGYAGTVLFWVFVDSQLVTVEYNDTSIVLPTDNFSEGWHIWWVEAEEEVLGVQTVSENQGFFGLDTSGPWIDSVTFLGDTVWSGPYDVDARVSDELSGVEAVELHYWLESTGEWYVVEMTPSGGRDGWYTGEIPAISHPWEEIRYFVVGFDQAEPHNETTYPPDGGYLSFHGFTVDTVMQPVMLLWPVDSVVVGTSDVGLEWQHSDGFFGVEGYRVYLDGELYGEVPDTFTVVMDLEEGWHIWQVVAYDSMGYQAISDPEVFGLDTTPPLLDSVTLWPDTTGTGPFEIQVWVWESLVPPDSVLLYYRRDEDMSWVSVPMAPLREHTHSKGKKTREEKEFKDSKVFRVLSSPFLRSFSGWYTGLIPETTIEPDTVRYYVRSWDAAIPPHVSSAPPGAPEQYYMFVAGIVGVQEREPMRHPPLLLKVSTLARRIITFEVRLARPAPVSLKVYDVLGRCVGTLLTGEKTQHQRVEWSPPARGVYFYHLESLNILKKGRIVVF